ncbi:hypothetical protein ACH4UY_35125 [Streptomyces longwoodensis]|uniref:hypothetical protein n=1 Tax=Streptomyces longwoodensis TaxID=68231 RepID=UPI0037AB56ED
MLNRFEHYVSLTVGGRCVGPVRITGPRLDEVFADYPHPREVGALERAAWVMARQHRSMNSPPSTG